MSESTLTHARVLELFRYDPETGDLVRRLSIQGGGPAGSVAGSVGPRGYLEVGIDGGRHKVHRVVWFYVTGRWPSHRIDHKDRVRSNNVWTNLRDVTLGVNNRNRALPPSNTTGIAGVRLDPKSGWWTVFIKAKGRSKYLGKYQYFFEACCVRKSAEAELKIHLDII